MAIAQKLTMRQGQNLVMTPQLSQSIKLLALSNIELAAFVEDEMERNPFLEIKPQEPSEDRNATDHSTDSVAPSDLTGQTELETSAKSLSENLGTSIENVYPDEQDYRNGTKDNAKSKEEYDSRISSGGLQLSGNASAHDQSVADYTAAHETLRDKLVSQLAISAASVTIIMIATDIIDNLDEAGYLRSELSTIAERLGCSEPECEQALNLVQGLEPVGVGARSLEECLSLQLKDKDRLDPAMSIVLENLDLLAKRDFATLRSLSNLDMEDLGDILLEIQSLDPKPGTMFESTPVQHIVPDVFVRESNDGSWQIELNSETLPRVLVNNSYVTEIGGKLSNPQEKDFLSDCMQTANWLTKSLDQRAQTILKVAREIVKQQDAFLVHGVRHLRPLTLKMVADEIDMHESSVSRVTSNKYMLTPRGLFELKYFFTTSLANAGEGESHSSEAVRDRIKSLIDAESAKTVLSDDAIVAALKSQGIEIARRTVAKYRDAMQIPSSVQRRREKRAFEAANLSNPVELTH
ncbi:MAG: RNA polymerase factor sigma-54 [Rhizobiaceae bacterium]|nr:RNA polymerase factor sigma-54 [Rhizobiaceae bacterium]